MQRYIPITRLIAAFVLGLATAVPGPAAAGVDVAAALAERSAGDPAAPVTVIEYASFTCPLCASFHTGAAYERLIERYVARGRVRFVFRDFPLDGVALRASMAARCADAADYFEIVRALYGAQDEWASAADPLAPLATITGLAADEMAACLASSDLKEGLFRLRRQGAELGVQFTPTYIVNGRVYPGSYSAEEFSEIIDPLVADR